MPTTDLKDKAARGFLWGALNNGATQVLNTVFGILLARRLGQADYGLIGMLAVFTLIANSLQDSGFVTALTNKRDATRQDYNAVFWFNIGVSLCLYILFFFCAPLIARFFDEPILTDLSRYYFLGFFIASFSIVPRAILFRQIRQRELAVMGLVSLLVSGIVGIAMAYNGMAYWGLATQTITFNLMVSILSWLLSGWRPTFPLSEWRESPSTWAEPIREMFAFSSKMLITNIFIGVNNNIFSLVLGKIYTKHEVGTYNQANKWNTMGASTITGMVQGVAQPTFVQVGDDLPRLRRAFSKMLRFTCFVSFPIMLGLSLVAPEFIVVLIGEKWLSSAHLMQLLCIGGAFLPIATLYYNLIISRGKSDVYMWNIIAQGCAILGSILIIHAAGGTITHMVIAYVAIVILWVGIWHRFLYQEIRYPFLLALRDILPFLLIATATMVITYFATRPLTAWGEAPNAWARLLLLLITRILLAAAIYLGTLWLFGAKILRECLGYLSKKK
ncbi:MAG: lipopolysaccharide biosynthesis protein [Bacteroidaceae bacterium]|nr:lipopolysaccharide biosynthesis protein [Bacteroidaceae bacterium]MBR1521100.1 lipopolysaccharide biosynthesis protein [Bacteroidaceae bacterium]